MKKIELKPVVGNWHTTSRAYVVPEPDTCDNCGHVAVVMDIDTSGEEYGSIRYCQACIDAAFAAAQEKEP